jgi:hypothetical protein
LFDASGASRRSAPRRAVALSDEAAIAGTINPSETEITLPGAIKWDDWVAGLPPHSGEMAALYGGSGQARTLSRAHEVVPRLHERPAHLRDRSPLAGSLRHLVGKQRSRLRSEQHGAGSAGGFVRRIARTPHYDGVKKDTNEPAVIGLFGIALDAYLIELALFKGELQSEPSHLDEVIDALFDLDETQAGTSAHRTRATGPDCEGRAA